MQKEEKMEKRKCTILGGKDRIQRCEKKYIGDGYYKGLEDKEVRGEKIEKTTFLLIAVLIVIVLIWW